MSFHSSDSTVLVRAVALTALLALAACGATPPPRPLPAGSAPYPAGLSEEERDLWRRSAELEGELRSKGLFLTEDSELTAYVFAVAARVAAAAGVRVSSFHFEILRDPGVNAFSLANGLVVVHAGLLARAENEAELAHVLAHEMAHTLSKHQLAGLQDRKTKTVTVKLADLALGGVLTPFLALTHAASINAYGRDQELAADRMAIRWMSAAGYRPDQALRLFSIVADEEDPGAWEAFFFANHPLRDERMREAAAAMGASNGSAGELGAEGYQRSTELVALRSIDLALQQQRYGKALRDAELQVSRRGESAWLDYYCGEAHRLLASDPDGAAREDARRRRTQPDTSTTEAFRARAAENRSAAEARFRKALSLDPALASARRGLGLLAADRGDRETARVELTAYLQDPRPIPDRRYVQQILAETYR